MVERVRLPRRLFQVDAYSILQAGLIAWKGCERRAANGILTALDLMSKEPDEEYQDFSRPRKVQYKCKWKVVQDASSWNNPKKAQDKGLKFWQTRSCATIRYTSVPLDCIKKVVSTSASQTFIERNHSVVPALGNQSQMRRDSRSTSEFKESHTKQYSRMKIEQGQFANWRILIKVNPERMRLITDLQKTHTFNPFSEESKRTIHSFGKIELFELSEVSAKTQCPSCAKYWPEGFLDNAYCRQKGKNE